MLKQTWRWFGPHDPITMDDLLQIGVEGIVSALHHIPPGAVWPKHDIEKRQAQIARRTDGSPSGLAWDVVESLPVSEAIKTRTGDYRSHLDAYCESLRNLAHLGLRTVCYNFMPVLDWTRTDLRQPLPHGGTAMGFDLTDFAVFDIHLLQRGKAQADYSEEIVQEAARRFAALSEDKRAALQSNIIAGLPGANDRWTLGDVRALLETYDGIDSHALRANLIAFLEVVVPVAAEVGINLCCHPDDPPFSLLGLPRVMSTVEDYATIMEAVDERQNGITLCTGSMGVAPHVNFVRFIKTWGHRIHFAHLRNTTRHGPNHGVMHSFYEAEHLGGDTDMVAVITALLDEQKRREAQGSGDPIIPMRPDHGHELLADIGANPMPGYPLAGRARGLAELRGVMMALDTRP